MESAHAEVNFHLRLLFNPIQIRTKRLQRSVTLTKGEKKKPVCVYYERNYSEYPKREITTRLISRTEHVTKERINQRPVVRELAFAKIESRYFIRENSRALL